MLNRNAEDVFSRDPTLRLDIAPSLNWLTRRSVLSAIHSGQLIVEPVASQRLHLDPSLATSILSPSSIHDLTCGLCGKLLYPISVDSSRPRPHPTHTSSGSWVSTSRFIKSQLSTSSSPTTTPSVDFPDSAIIPPQTYVFRLALPSTPSIQGNGLQKGTPMYPLCHDGFCLTRLRSTCELWHFVRISLIEHVWNEPRALPPKHPRSHSASLVNGYTSVSESPTGSPPPSLPARRNVAARVGNLWGMGLGALSREKSVSRGATPPPEPEMMEKVLEKRRVPPPYTHTSTPSLPRRESIEGGASPKPPLPPRRRPTTEVQPSPQKFVRDMTPEPDTPTKDGGTRQNLFGSESDTPSENPAILEEADSTVISDSATVIAKPENSGLLTPRSEHSEGFKTPPEHEHGNSIPSTQFPSLSDPVLDPTHLLAVNTQLPVSRPISQIVDGDAVREQLEQAPPSTVPASEDADPSPSPEKSKVPGTPPVPAPSPSPLLVTNTSPRPPPPLPRRAATRERPMSMFKPAVDNGSVGTSSSAPLAPVVDAEVINREPTLVEEVEVDKKSEELSAPTPGLDVSGPTTAAGQNGVDDHVSSHRADSLFSENSEYPSAVNPTVQADIPSVNGDEGDAGKLMSDSIVPNAQSTSSPTTVGGGEANSETWEEKRWKELVRLREDMFWARIGGWRATVTT